MKYSARLLIALLLAATLPIAALAFLIRQEMTERLTADYVRAAESAITQTEALLHDQHRQIRTSLAALSAAIPDDNRFRRSAVDDRRDERTYLLDYAGLAMRLTGLAMLQIQDESGRIISSGHFRNEYDRIDTALPGLLRTEGLALARVRSPEGPFIVLVAADTVKMGGRRFSVAGGMRIDQIIPETLLTRKELTVDLVTDPANPSSGGNVESAATRISENATASVIEEPDSATGEIVRELRVPLIDTQQGTVTSAAFRIKHDVSGLAELQTEVDRLFLIVATITAILAALIALWLAARMSRPIAELADKASSIDLDRLNVAFKTDRRDEIGELSRVLRRMMERLRTSSATIRDAERRATLGEIARQVNHDIKNGLAPIRNVFRHLSEISTDDPDQLPSVFRDREQTLTSGMNYLEDLASNYARLSPVVARDRTDVNTVIRQTVDDFVGGGAKSLVAVASGAAFVYADPLSLRRILENLIANALDAVKANGARKPSVVVRSEHAASEDHGDVIRITITDNGPGLSAEEISKVFQDFYTTKSRGTGLGLSIVRRLVMDMEGSVRVESDPGNGARFIVDLPQMKGV